MKNKTKFIILSTILVTGFTYAQSIDSNIPKLNQSSYENHPDPTIKTASGKENHPDPIIKTASGKENHPDPTIELAYSYENHPDPIAPNGDA